MNPPIPKKISVDLTKLNNKIRGKARNCPLCRQSNTFSALPHLMELRDFREGGFVLGSDADVLPLVTLICENCGNVVFLSAIQLGLLEEKNDTQNYSGEKNE